MRFGQGWPSCRCYCKEFLLVHTELCMPSVPRNKVLSLTMFAHINKKILFYALKFSVTLAITQNPFEICNICGHFNLKLPRSPAPNVTCERESADLVFELLDTCYATNELLIMLLISAC